MPFRNNPDKFSTVGTGDSQDRPGVRTIVTTDHAQIRAWAAEHGAVPATGEATASGPAVKHVTDGGPGIRFNFPGFSPFRPIAWDEWLANFDQHQLAFVYEQADPIQVADRAQALSRARRPEEGDEKHDWFEAEHELQRRGGGTPLDTRYKIVRRELAILR